MVSKHFKLIFFLLVISLGFNLAVIAQSKKVQQHVEVSMRMIGHQLLLNSGDSLSLVLPIEKVRDRFRINFESTFEFNPDELVATIDSVVKETKIANSYLVEVEQCETGKVVYSYEIGDSVKTDVIPCGTRKQPKACYNIFISILDSDESLTEVIPPLSKNIISISERSKFYITTSIIFLFMLAGLFIYFRRRKNKNASNSDKTFVGKYEFDKNNMLLIYNNEQTELSGKETDLLFLLYSSANKTIERDVILNAVWGDEGDYIGRTLDVFISKLRKKLEGDPKVKITNIRGIGYKLILYGEKD